jgi:hypothetical protein
MQYRGGAGVQITAAQEYRAHPVIGIDRGREDLARGADYGWFVFADDRCSGRRVPARH